MLLDPSNQDSAAQHRWASTSDTALLDELNQAPEVVLVGAMFCVHCGLTLIASSQEGPGVVSPQFNPDAADVPCEVTTGSWSSAVGEGRARLVDAGS